ncbi:MAG TPA: OmcA/MtrC family decaheme c-type cytochrome, partial [Bryobacteraceae bacterium]|nr:OmcA/MtrC family decaheme c-type cytochrome [Bryobacteraceae bacterium]
MDFLRPGLNITINSGSIAKDGTITVAYTLTDPMGLPLDPAGIYTPGPITLGYIAAYIPANQEQYTAYTTSSAKGTAGTFTVAGADSGGVVTALDSGKYQYVFKTKAPAGFDASATHTIGVYARRDMSAFNIPNNNASTVYSFVPDGSPVTHVRDIIKTPACNSCHDQLSHHGGRRRQVEMCVLCHTPQSVDPNTGATVDFKVMIHKIHMGSQLPSVIAGTPYKVINTDFSTVVFPSDIRRCEKCHDQTSGATQANYYFTKPTGAACGACHDNVNFATGLNHVGGPQKDDNLCSTCHFPQGELEFDASIKGAHVIPTESASLSGIQILLSGVQNNAAGQKPVVSFTVKDGQGNALPLSKLDSISFTMAGPASDYGYTSFGSDVTTPGYVTESALAGSTCGTDGICTYSFAHAISSDAKGTYSIGVEARRTETLLANTTKQQTVRYSPKNQVINFSVDASPVVARRTVVDINNCNSRCHTNLSMHGGPRNQTAYCVLCHNPSNTDAAMRPIAQVPADQAAPAQG